MKVINVQEVQQLIGDTAKLVVIDIRETYERDICMIESIHIPMSEIATKVNEIPTSDKIAIMCKSGKRAEATVNLLEKDFDLDNIYIFDGGILNWIENIDSTLELY